MVDFLVSLNNFIWGAPFILFVMLIGLYFTARSGLFTFAHFGHVMKNTLGSLTSKEARKKDDKSVSPFEAVCVAIGGCVGTANIAGVATAMATGGYGAVFWLWLWAFFGMMVKIVEVTLGCYYRGKDENENYYGGPMYYMEKGFDVGENFERQLEFYTNNNEFNYIAYLLADNNRVSIKVAKYVGDDVDEIEEYYEFGDCSLITATYRVLEKFKTENKVFAKITYPERIQKSMYDYNAVREAIINAIVHNDWSNEYPPKFEFFSDRLEISSFGGIQDEFTEEEFLKGYSAPKNPELMRVFKDLELVEHLGTGIRKILKKYNKSIYQFYPHFIIVSIKYNENDFEYNIQNQKVKFDYSKFNLSKMEESIIKLILDRPNITQAEMAAFLNLTPRMVRYHLSELVNNGYIKRIGAKKNGKWIVIGKGMK